MTPRPTPDDTCDFQPLDVHGRWLRQAAHRLYPRRMVRALGDGFGWNLLIRAS
ncbi:MAG: hypothetical protein ACYCWW_00740 [Deltaproteobacteria bacterium]